MLMAENESVKEILCVFFYKKLRGVKGHNLFIHQSEFQN